MDFFGAQDTNLTYDTKCFVFDKTAFVKFKIRNNYKQNIDETHQNSKIP